MKNLLDKKWAVVAVIWTVAAGLTAWNVKTIYDIIPLLEREDVLRMDTLFWKFNSEKISQILKRKNRLQHPTASVKLGLLAVENRLQSLASGLGLTEFKALNHPNRVSDEDLPVNLSFRGTLNSSAQWLHRLEDNFPFMRIERITFFNDPEAEQGEFQLDLRYRYTIIPSEVPS